MFCHTVLSFQRILLFGQHCPRAGNILTHLKPLCPDFWAESDILLTTGGGRHRLPQPQPQPLPQPLVILRSLCWLGDSCTVDLSVAGRRWNGSDLPRVLSK